MAPTDYVSDHPEALKLAAEVEVKVVTPPAKAAPKTTPKAEVK